MAKGVRVTTPVVALVFPNIDREDFKYHNFGTGFRVPADHPLVAQIDEYREDNFTAKEKKHPKFGLGYKKDPENEGFVLVTAKSRSQQAVYDVKGRVIEPPAVGAGTKARVSISIDTSKGENPGVVVRYNGLQVINLIERQGAFGDMSGEVEDGYEADADQLARGKEMDKARREGFVKKDDESGSAGPVRAVGEAVEVAKANTDF